MATVEQPAALEQVTFAKRRIAQDTDRPIDRGPNGGVADSH